MTGATAPTGRPTTRSGQRPRIAVTCGDPGGIGPELVARLLARPGTTRSADVLVVSDERELAEASAAAGVQVRCATTPTDGEPLLVDTGARRPAGPFALRRATAEGGRWALDALEVALGMAGRREVDAVVFAPLNKSSLHAAGMDEPDELRWFESVLGARGATSELNAAPGLWTSRVTSHVSIAEVAEGITHGGVVGAIRLLDAVLREVGVAAPRLGVCALNPHAGESGRFGRHETEVIAPAVATAVGEGLDVRGPFPSDTIFLGREDYDGIVTMYHDQGQIAMKLLGFEGGVTVAGGLDVPICTPAHGTAFDLVGLRRASTASMERAFEIACRLGAARSAR